VRDDEVIQTHYRRLGPNYNALLQYSPDFVRTLTSKMIEELRLHEDDRFVDLGCGTGMYTVDLLQQVPLRQPAIGVDPFAEMLAHIPDDAHIVAVQADALEFSARAGSYDKVLIKEAVHHIDQRKQLFRNLHERLAPGGELLVAEARQHRHVAVADHVEVALLRQRVGEVEAVPFDGEASGVEHPHDQAGRLA
jgi:ubiquinone/menaquinone biosynthesis C-methylase UbiE